MTDLKISATDARHILVAIDKLPPSFYSTEAYGAAIRLHQQLIRHDIEHAKIMKALLANADKLVGVCDLQQAMCRQITTEGVSKTMKADLKERMALSDNRQLYTSFDARPEMSNGIPNLNSITLYYRFTEDLEAFDRSVRAERDKIYPPEKRTRK